MSSHESVAPTTPLAPTMGGENSPIPPGQRSPGHKPKQAGKAKGKAKPKGSPKVKAATKQTAKAAAKGRANTRKRPAATVMKKPSATDPAEAPATIEIPAKKKPSAAKMSLDCFGGLTGKYADSPSAVQKHGEEDPEEEAGLEEDMEIEPDSEHEAEAEKPGGAGKAKMDRSKRQKFKAMLNAGLLPDQVVESWNKFQLVKRGKKDLERNLIEKMFTRDSSGSLKANFDDHTISNSKAFTCHMCVCATCGIPLRIRAIFYMSKITCA